MHLKPIARKLSCIPSILLFVFLFISFTCQAAMAASVAIKWDPNDPAPDGYRVFVRAFGQAHDYSQPTWEGSATACTIDHLEDYTDYYFVVRAFTGALESADSAEVHYYTAASASQIPVADADHDGMPDDWEIIFGLDPTIDDADDDYDADGVSNIDEYHAGLEPDEAGQGVAPLSPLPVSPIDYAEVETNPILTAADYADEEGDAHIATQWQIFDADTGECLLDVVSDLRLTRLQVPALLLDGEMTCSWRLRFFDSSGRVSEWSASAYFNTASPAGDFDGDGISDDQRGFDTPSGDVHTLTSTGLAHEPTAISADSEDSTVVIEKMAVVDPQAFETDETTPQSLPSSMVAYKLTLDEPGQTAQVTVNLSDAVPAGATWVKYDAVKGWQDLSQYAVISEDRRSVTVEVQDGGHGDADGVANGVIVDQAGLALASENSSDSGTSVAGSSTDGAAGGGGGGGCFITASLGADQPMGMVHGLWHWLKTKARGLIAVISS